MSDPVAGPGLARDVTVDVARGLAIVLIVVGHVVRGLSGGGQVDPLQPWYGELDAGLYLVHLPVFVLLAGAYLPRGVARDGARPYLRARLSTLAWCFVLWTGLQGAVQVAAGRLANTPMTVTDLLRQLVAPTSQLWFLPTLAALTLAVVLARPWASTARTGALVVVAAALSLATWGVFGTWAGTEGMGLAVCFAAGVVLGQTRLSALLRSAALPAVALGCAVGLAVLLVVTDPTPPTFSAPSRTAASVALGVLGVVLGLGATAGVSRLVAATPLAGPAVFLGRMSLPIFLAHIVFASGSRVVLGRLTDDPLVLAVAGVVCGLAGSMALVLLARRLPLRWLFDVPLPRVRTSVRT